MKLRSIILGYVLVAVLMISGAASLLYNLEPLFDRVNKQIAEGRTVVINHGVRASALDSMLIMGGYVNDPKDAKLISSWYAGHINNAAPLENLGAINAKRFGISADTIADMGGDMLQSRLIADLNNSGQDSIWATLDIATLPTTYGQKCDMTALIPVKVTVLNDTTKQQVPAAGVTVRLTEYSINDSVPSANLPISLDNRTVGYAVTDKDGIARFYAPKGKSYSVVPIKAGYKFGSEKGTKKEVLDGDLAQLTFKGETYRLRPFSPALYGLMKKDLALVSRSPAQFIDGVHTGIAVFLASWLFVFIATMLIDSRAGGRADYTILLMLMVLSGLGLLTLYGQMLPLTDIYNAAKMSRYIAYGCLALVGLSMVNYLKLYQKYQSRWVGKLQFGGGALRASMPGMPFLALAVLMMIALYLFGAGPEGSDARVNLGFFQPSEVVKYLILIFIAFFFIARGEVISTFGQRLTILARRRQLKIVGVVLAAIALVSLLFLAMLKDMGPGIVVLTTFIMLYSIVRRDFPQLMLGIVSYVIIVGVVYMVTSSTVMHIAAIGLWFVLWITYWYMKQRTVCESAIFFNTLISLFLVGGHLIRPFLPHMAERLLNRTSMAWGGIFDNAVPQGDQIAQGLWGTASGGITGMGFGGGSSYIIPAGHTDLILSSLGEQTGWLGILLVCICMFILVSRTTSSAQYSAHRFTMYLCLGLGLLTGVQFLFIALGSVGAIPLSGVPVPFMSYSGTSIIMALAAYGVVISISRHPGTSAARKAYVVNDRRTNETDESRHARVLERNLFAGMVLFFIGTASVAAINGYYQFIADAKTKLRPSITNTSRGLRVLDYNPRIKAVIDRLELGNIYDRNSLLLATSSRSELDTAAVALAAVGIDRSIIDAQQDKRLRRYYPLGANTVFIVGDLNRPDVYGNSEGVNPSGLYAENEYDNLLRGYNRPAEVISLNSSNYSISSYTPKAKDVTTKAIKYDYSALLPALKAPLYRNKWIDDFNSRREQRDIYLSIDGALQADMQTRMAEAFKKGSKYLTYAGSEKYLRASAVVLDAVTGELLTSANYPLPEPDSILSMVEQKLDRKSGAPSEWRPGPPVTERDLGMTYFTPPGSTAKVMTAMAGLQKLGPDAKNKGFEILPYMTVEPATKEPNSGPGASLNRNGGKITHLDYAIKNSSNCYFIMLLNEENLYPQAFDLYGTVGAAVDRNFSYVLNIDELNPAVQGTLKSSMSKFQANGLKAYNDYMRNSPATHKSMSTIQSFTGIAWGQGSLEATPLTMARVASTVANGGKLMPTRYLRADQKLNKQLEPIVLLDQKANAVLAEAMQLEASRHFGSAGRLSDDLNGLLGGKTGTPERPWKKEGAVKNKINDAWYMCYITPGNGKHPIAIAVRLERTRVTSGYAVRFVNEVVVPALRQHNYL